MKGSIWILKKKRIRVISFTGHSKNNPLSKLSKISLWVNSKAYNYIENIHQIWLLGICDLIIGKREYPAKKKITNFKLYE